MGLFFCSRSPSLQHTLTLTRWTNIERLRLTFACPNTYGYMYVYTRTNVMFACVYLVVITCTCTNGTPTVFDGSAGTLCEVHDRHDCSACNAGYRLSAAAGTGAQTCLGNIPVVLLCLSLLCGYCSGVLCARHVCVHSDLVFPRVPVQPTRALATTVFRLWLREVMAPCVRCTIATTVPLATLVSI